MIEPVSQHDDGGNWIVPVTVGLVLMLVLLWLSRLSGYIPPVGGCQPGQHGRVAEGGLFLCVPN